MSNGIEIRKITGYIMGNGASAALEYNLLATIGRRLYSMIFSMKRL